MPEKTERELIEDLFDARRTAKAKTEDQAEELKYMIRHFQFYYDRLSDLFTQLQIVRELVKVNPNYAGYLDKLEKEEAHCLHCLLQIFEFKNICDEKPDIITEEEIEKVLQYHLKGTKKDDLKAIYGKDGSVIAKEAKKTIEKAIRYLTRISEDL